MTRTSTLPAPSTTPTPVARTDRREHIPRTTSATSRTTRPVWMPWATDTWIATGHDESVFVDELRALGNVPSTEHTRADITACLNALRCGLTVDDLLDRTPGLRPERLHAAYQDLEQRRAHAERAWTAIVAAGSVDALVEHGEAAAALLPAVIGRLVVAARTHPVSLATAVLRMADAVDKCRRDTSRIEQALARCAPGSDRGRELGGLLYQPLGPSVASRDDFLADRVGMLTPTRVASLLGELDCVVTVPLRDLAA